MESRYTWLNGTLMDTSKATVPFLTTGLHYGIAVFEGIRAYATDRGPAVFRLQDHLRRFEQSNHILGFRELPYSREQLTRATMETVNANGYDECYIRPLSYLAEGGWNLTLDSGRVHIGIAVWRQSVYSGRDVSTKGIRACVSSFTRHHPNAAMTKAKISGNYVNSVMAKTDAQRQGLDEAILLDPEGYVGECSGANLFLVRGGTVVTPVSDGILEGITRSTVIALARHAGLEVVEARVSRDHLYVADEVFVCGTAAEVIGVSEIDHRPVGGGSTGPITRLLGQAYQDAVHGRHPLSAGWLEHAKSQHSASL